MGFSIRIFVFYIFDVIISFLPYFLILFFILNIVFVYRILKKYRYYYFNLLFFCINLFLFILLLFNFFSFYTFYSLENFSLSDNKSYVGSGISVLYSNIYYENTNYTGIINNIKKYNPDIVVFVEHADHHLVIDDYMLDNYYYTGKLSITKRNTVSNYVYSKIPLYNISIINYDGFLEFGSFDIKHNNKLYKMYVVHTTSPVSYYNFLRRNSQLDFLSNYLSNNLTGNTNIVFGDFNISPWSILYKKTIQIDGLYNHTNNFDFLYTWYSRHFPFATSHIDYVFANLGNIFHIKKIHISGSDHMGAFFVLD